MADDGNELRTQASLGNELTVRRLLEKGVPVDVADKEGVTALIKACSLPDKHSGQHDKVVKILLDKGANIEAKKVLRCPALDAACVGLQIVIPQYPGRPPQVKGQRGTALSCACLYGKASVVKILLDRGAEVNAATEDGKRTPLMLAIQGPKSGGYDRNGREEVVKLLLDHGADVNARTQNGNALDMARGKLSESVLKLLESKMQLPQRTAKAVAASRAQERVEAEDAVAMVGRVDLLRQGTVNLRAMLATGKLSTKSQAVARAHIEMRDQEYREAEASADALHAAQIRVFVSFEFAEAYDEALALQSQLERRGVSTFVSGKQKAGASLQKVIISALDNAQVVVVLGTKTYGVESGSFFSTLQEMNYALEEGKQIYLFKMCSRWDEAVTRVNFTGKKYKEWTAGKPVPDGALHEIITLLGENVPSPSSAQSSTIGETSAGCSTPTPPPPPPHSSGSTPHSGPRVIKAFASMRFGKDEVHKHEAPALKAALAVHGVELFVAAPNAGENISQVVFDAIAESTLFIALATSTYAEDTGNPACTFKELAYWQSKHREWRRPPEIPIKMLRDGEAFDVSRQGVRMADVLFSNNAAYEVWPLGSTRQANGGCTVPDKLVSKILEVAKPYLA